VLAIVVSHAFLVYADFFGAMSTADFFLRANGEASNPNKLFPLERAFCVWAGHMHLVVLLGFLAALAGAPYIQVPGAAFMCAASHLSLAVQLLLRHEQWHALFFVDASLSWRTMLLANVVWGVAGVALMIMSHGDAQAVRQHKPVANKHH